MKWFGQSAMEGYTQNPLGFWIVTPIKSAEKHPILNGVHRWIYKDGDIFAVGKSIQAIRTAPTC